jgi:quercetin dioxygenase-like cupin family protein
MKGGGYGYSRYTASGGPGPRTGGSESLQSGVENDRVRVLRIKYGPGGKSVMHGHPALVGVFLTDGRFLFTYPDGKSEEIEGKAGQVLFFDAFAHLPENLSDRPFEGIAVELKT